MDPIAEMLKRIKAGEQRFAPEDDSEQALRDFQPVVQLLKEVAKRELIASLTLPAPSKGRDTYGLTVVAIVSGGLTYPGEQYLASPPRRTSETKTWVLNHLAQIAVSVIAGVIVIVIVVRWGLQ